MRQLRYGRAPIEIRAEQDDRHFRLTVEDEGEGVPEELVPLLFRRFARGNGAEGSGLGLAIAQSYAQANGVRSSTPTTAVRASSSCCRRAG